MTDQAESLRRMVKEREIDNTGTRIIGIFSGKGGVGKSSIAINLAFGLKDFDKKVLLIDCDVGLYNLSLLMGMDNKTPGKFSKLLRGIIKWDEIILSTDYGIDFLGGTGRDPFVAEPEFGFIDEIKASERYQYIIIDTSPGVHGNLMKLTDYTNINAVITTPELTSITDSYALIKSLVTEKKSNLFHLIVNRSFSSQESETTYYRLENVVNRFLHANLEFLGYMSEDKIIKESVKYQYPAFLTKPYAPSMVCIRDIARKIVSYGLTSEHRM